MARGKYQEWLTEDSLLRIESWASDGLTDDDIAKNMGISRTTFYNWQNKYSDILNALKKGREPVVRELENALIKKAKGFEYEESDVIIDKDKNGNTSQRVIKHKRYSPPDSSAAMFLLKNYKPDKYRNYNELTKRQIEAEIRKLEAEAKAAEKELSEQAEDMPQIIIVDEWNNKDG